MNNFQLPIQMIQMLKGGSNPQDILMNMVQTNMDNPLSQNIVTMMNNRDSKGIETIARNLCSSRGIDPDELMKNIQSQLK